MRSIGHVGKTEQTKKQDKNFKSKGFIVHNSYKSEEYGKTIVKNGVIPVETGIQKMYVMFTGPPLSRG